MKLSVVIPAQNEIECIESVVADITAECEKEGVDHEIIVVDDCSTDGTGEKLDEMLSTYKTLRVIHRQPPCGFGRAICDGLKAIEGDAVVTAMGDASDDPRDIIRYFRKIEEGYDCVFGSRFIKGSNVCDYPRIKLLVNRVANTFVRLLFRIDNNDMTNAFKAYRAEVIRAVMPIEALYFNITVELPLKALVRGFSYCTIPINWYGRKSGVAKLKIREMGRKYLYSVLHVWLEKMLLKDDYRAK